MPYKDDSDNFSIFSAAETLVDVPWLPSQGPNGWEDGDYPIELGAKAITLYNQYDQDIHDKELESFNRVGFHSQVLKTTDSTSKSPMKKKKKRLVINFPLRALEVAPTRVPDPDSVAEVERRLAARPTKGKFASLFQWQVAELLGVRRRELLSGITSCLYKNQSLLSSFSVLPNERVLDCPRNYRNKDDTISIQYTWATMNFTAPTTGTGPEQWAQEDKVKTEEEIQAHYTRFPDLKPGARGTVDQLFARLQERVSQEAEAQMTSLLTHLDSRGVLWTDAGHDFSPTIAVPDPRRRHRFVVLALVPETFVDRIKKYMTKKRGQRRWQPESEDKNGQLLINIGDDGSSAETKGDFLVGWEATYTPDPFYNGLPPAQASWAIGGGMGMIGIGAGSAF